MITFNALDWFDYAWHKVTEVKSGKYNSASVRRTNPASWEQITNWDWFTVFKLIYKIKRWFHHWISRSCECKACITSSQIVFACLLLFLFVLYLSICVLCVSIDSNPERQGGSCQMAFLAWYLCLYICLFVFVFFCICLCVFIYQTRTAGRSGAVDANRQMAFTLLSTSGVWEQNMDGGTFD